MKRSVPFYLISVVVHALAFAVAAYVASRSLGFGPRFALVRGSGGTPGARDGGLPRRQEGALAGRWLPAERAVRVVITPPPKTAFHAATPRPARPAAPIPAVPPVPRVASAIPAVPARRPEVEVDHGPRSVPTVRIPRRSVVERPAPAASFAALPRASRPVTLDAIVDAGVPLVADAAQPTPGGRRVAGTPDGHGSGRAVGNGGSGGSRFDNPPVAMVANPLPPYPLEAQARGVEGVVQLRVALDADGRVQHVTLHASSGDATLDEAALTTVRDRWQFQPARLGSTPVACEVIVPVRFRLQAGR